MLNRFICAVFLLMATPLALAVDTVASTFREGVVSKILGQTRDYSVYLPPSYFIAKDARFPVLYVVDGDYHFPYLPGLIEQMSVSGEQIPEMIIIAIGEPGKAAYRKEIKPEIIKGDGADETFRKFLVQELIPQIDVRYRTASYRALLGQSFAGLFATTTLLAEPALFNSWYVLSPSLWWQDYALTTSAEALFKTKPQWQTRLYLSLANERGMGVRAFVDLLERMAPRGLSWQFKQFELENHGSVTLPALQWALREEFAGFEMSSKRFRAYANGEQFIDSYRDLKTKLGFEFLLPPTLLTNALYGYMDENKTADIAVLERGISEHFPQSLPPLLQAQADIAMEAGKWAEAVNYCQGIMSKRPFDAHWCAAKAEHGMGNPAAAKLHMQQAIKLAQAMQLRQWRWNQLHADARNVGVEKSLP